MSSYEELVAGLRNADTLDRMKITRTNDELRDLLGQTVCRLIDESGFVLVPRQWQNDVMAALTHPDRPRQP
jgi:hypothetical protein